jgi:predicted dehydrogenase
VSVKVAIIGTGWAERVQIPAFAAAGLEVVGIAGRSREKMQRVASEHGIPFVTTDWHELLERECDLVSVTSPPALHFEQAIAVLASGKHLLCEKPLALNHAQAQAMLAEAQKHPEQLALVDHELRFTPARRKAKELLDARAIGRILVVTARVTSNMRMDPATPWNWWSDVNEGGGILGAIGSHVFDGIRWLLEEHTGPIVPHGAALGVVHPERTTIDGDRRRVSADDIASVSFRMGDAVGTAIIHGAALDEPVDLLTIRGTEGTLVIDKSLRLYVNKDQGPLKEYVTHLPGIVPNRFRSSPYASGTVLLAQALADALERDAPQALRVAATLQDGVRVQALLDDIRRLAAAVPAHRDA